MIISNNSMKVFPSELLVLTNFANFLVTHIFSNNFFNHGTRLSNKIIFLGTQSVSTYFINSLVSKRLNINLNSKNLIYITIAQTMILSLSLFYNKSNFEFFDQTKKDFAGELESIKKEINNLKELLNKKDTEVNKLEELLRKSKKIPNLLEIKNIFERLRAIEKSLE